MRNLASGCKQVRLTQDRVSYVNELISNFILEKELNDLILRILPVPNNIDKVHQINNFIKHVLNEKGKSRKQFLEAVLEKLQRKTRDIYRPMARIWNYLEELNNWRDEWVEADIGMLLTCMEKTVLLSCQTVYIEHVLILSQQWCPLVNQIIVLREKVDMIGDKMALFGKEFTEHTAEIKKAKRRQWWFQNRHQIPFDQLSHLVRKDMVGAEWTSF